jgi:Polyketide cyclase / dehydrase and lipid transport
MARSYYSVVLDYPADKVWAVIRPFDHYAWAGVESDVVIEQQKAGDQVGAVRRIDSGANVSRQVLLAHSDIDRCYSYAFAGGIPIPVQDYTATIRVVPVVADQRSFVEWWATFDCAEDERDKWMLHFERQGFAKWLAALDRFMAKVGCELPPPGAPQRFVEK